MKISRLFRNPLKKLAAAGLVALAFALPAATMAASTVKIEATTTVANATKSAGTNNWSSSTTATYNEVVAVQVVYDNTETAGSGKTANNLHVKINIPTAAGAKQTVTTSTVAGNSNTVNGSSVVNLDRSDAYLQYIPGTATWKHATVDNADVKGTANVVTQHVSDDVVLGANGLDLGTEKPCQAGSIVVQARVMVPGVSIDKYVSQNGKWVTSNTANPGETLTYKIEYKNTGNTTQQHVVLRDNLPPKMTYVAGSTMLYDASHPSGVAIAANEDWLMQKGVDAGSFSAGSNAIVTFKVTIPAATELACGQTEFRNVGVVQPQGMNEYYNTAITTVNKTCETTPAYACTAFHVTVGENRTVKVDSFTFTASDGSKLSMATLNWGDNNTLETNAVVGQSHTYAADGTYVISVSNFMVNGKKVDVSGNCSQSVTFTSGTPKELPNTGAGDVIGVFAGVVVASAIGYRLYLSRKFAR